MAGNAENQSGDAVRTTYHIVGKDIRAIQYTVVDGFAIAEGCLILDTAQGAAETFERVRQNPGLLRKSVFTLGTTIKGSQYRWLQGLVPYQINAGLPDQARVAGAIAHWQAETKIRFVERTPQNAGQYPDYVEFIPGTGCSAAVGRRGGRQVVTLGPDCSTGNCIHEIGHALGLWHEQSRTDRDIHVEVLWQNIQSGLESNFYQHITDGEDQGPYDLGSIMHYPLDAFSKNGQPTLRLFGDAGGVVVGQRNGLSQQDKNTIAAIYPP
jgi:hypothetical protein